MTPRGRTPRSLALAVRLWSRSLVKDSRSFVASVALLATAVALFTGYATVSASSDVSLQARVARALGGADARVAVVRPTSSTSTVAGLTDAEELRRALEPSATVAPVVEVPSRLGAGDRTVAVTATLADFSLPLVQPSLVLRSGRWPATPGEAALSTSVAERLGVAPGAQLRAGSSGAPVTVVGLLTDPVDLGAPLAVLPLDDASYRSVVLDDQQQASVVFLVRASPDQLAATGLPFLDRQQIVDRAGQGRGSALGLVAGAVLVACTGGAVLALAARRQRRTVALLDVLGADLLLRVLVPVATVLAIAGVGGVVGAVAGFAGAAAVLPALARRAGQEWVTPGVDPSALALLAGVLALVAVATSLGSALALRRWSALTAIAGRETATGRPAPRGTVVVAALSAAVVGAGWALRQPALVVPGAAALGVAASGLALAGVCGALARTGGPVWLALAVRNLQRLTGVARTVVAAVAGFATVSCLAALLLTSLTLSTGYVPQLPAGSSSFTSGQQLRDADLGRVAAQLGADRFVQLRDAVREQDGFRSYLQVRNPLQECLLGDTSGSTRACAARTGWPVLSPRVSFLTADQVETYLGRPLSVQDRAAYAGGTALVLFPALVRDGRLTVWAGPSAEGSLDGGATSTDASDTLDLPARLVPVSAQPTSDAPAVLLPPGLSGRDGLTAGSSWDVLFLGRSTPTTTQEDQARDALVRAAAGVGTFSVERGDPHLPLARAITRTAGLAAGLAGSAATTLLALLVAAGQRREQAVLDAIGAPGRSRRAAAAVQILLPTAVALVVGALAGLLAAWLCAGFEHVRLTLSPAGPLALAGACSLVAAALAATAATARRPGPPRQAD